MGYVPGRHVRCGVLGQVTSDMMHACNPVLLNDDCACGRPDGLRELWCVQCGASRVIRLCTAMKDTRGVPDDSALFGPFRETGGRVFT